MREIIKLLTVTFFIFSFQYDLKSQDKDCIPVAKVELKSNESPYPWRVEITKLAIEAIHESIRNLKLAKDKPGPYNVRFTQDKIVEFEIVGYHCLDDEPNIYHIEFRPEDERGAGDRITVKVNIETNEIISVYMQADA